MEEKKQENKSHSYIKTFLWHVSASTGMNSKVIRNACCLPPRSGLKRERGAQCRDRPGWGCPRLGYLTWGGDWVVWS